MLFSDWLIQPLEAPHPPPLWANPNHPVGAPQSKASWESQTSDCGLSAQLLLGKVSADDPLSFGLKDPDSRLAFATDNLCDIE